MVSATLVEEIYSLAITGTMKIKMKNKNGVNFRMLTFFNKKVSIRTSYLYVSVIAEPRFYHGIIANIGD